ncbi:zinc ribbon domain-containing protein [Pseudomonas cavernicola]|uniref:Zinc ribbon domain-containing protein n=1 Tax=Pseudomonas cavernicola TaxID=2320866 RepID=A0A418XFA2_9PSED|nr:zinc ribbon domain-containing protein [Pseudomonas cavernicola]RJG11110.1 zinc ribbon domain-containing protein [Pseudomonas cavernicola]
MNCYSCRAELIDGAKFCISCGTNLESKPVCSTCKSELNPGAIFCGTCGNATKTNRTSDFYEESLAIVRTIIYKLFPKMQDCPPVQRPTYWNMMAAGLAACIVTYLLIAIALFEITASKNIASAIGNIAGSYVFLKIWGHFYKGRLIDAGVYRNKKYINTSIAIAVVFIFSAFVSPLVSSIASLAGTIICIVVGCLKSKNQTDLSAPKAI